LQLEKTVLEAQTAQRGYLLSRKNDYLAPFQKSVEAIRPLQREVLDLAYQDKAVRDRLTELSQLIALKLADMERSIKVASADEFERTLAVLEGEEGRQLTEKIRAGFADLNNLASRQMETNTARYQDSMETSRSAILTAVGLNVVLIATLALVLIREHRRTREETRVQSNVAERLESEVEKRTGELSSLSAFLQTNSEREKAALARELHDELGGILTPAKMDLAWLQGRLGGDPEYGERMNRLSKLIDQGIDLKRRIIENLRPSLLDHLGLASALQWYADEACKAANLECTLHIAEGLERMPADLEIALYRVVQESITNVVKHARAKKVDLIVERTPKGLKVVVSDDGVGIADLETAKKMSHGLAGMSHRVRSVHGSIPGRVPLATRHTALAGATSRPLSEAKEASPRDLGVVHHRRRREAANVRGSISHTKPAKDRIPGHCRRCGVRDDKATIAASGVRDDERDGVSCSCWRAARR
jgi:signal transduction histidine kinase